MSEWEDRAFLLAVASAAIAFVLFVVDLGETPLIFENLRAEVSLILPLFIWQSWFWISQRRRSRP